MRRLLFYLLLTGIWAAASSSSWWPDGIAPAPLQVGEAIVAGLADNSLVVAVLASFRRLCFGYGAAVIVGSALGLLLARDRLADEMLGPLVAGLQSIPSIAWLPLTAMWFGFSEPAIILIVFFGAVWSMTINTQIGVRNVPPLLIRAGRNMGASGAGLLTSIILPAAFPQILTGWRLGWAFSWRALMAGELLSPGAGLGKELMLNRNASDTAGVIAVILVIGLVGSIVDALLFLKMERSTRRRWGLAPA